MYERRWHRWAAPVWVALVTTAGAANLGSDHHGQAFLAPGHTSIAQVNEFGGGTASVAQVQSVTTYAAIAGTAVAGPGPPLSLRGAL
jgi:hypothetical protein